MLTIGLAVLALLAVLLVTDVSSMFLRRRSLSALADAAALAGAQAIDLDAYLRRGPGDGPLALDSAAVAVAVRAHLQAARAYDAIPGLSLQQVRTDGGRVTVVLQAPAAQGLSGLSAPGAVIRASASAQLRVR